MVNISSSSFAAAFLVFLMGCVEGAFRVSPVLLLPSVELGFSPPTAALFPSFISIFDTEGVVENSFRDVECLRGM